MNSRLSSLQKKENHQRQRGTLHNDKMVSQEDIILNVYAELQTQKQIELRRETDKSTIIVGGFQILLSTLTENQQGYEELNHTKNQIYKDLSHLECVL